MRARVEKVDVLGWNKSYAVLVFDLWNMLICGGGINILFLREQVTNAFKLPIHKERFYTISTIVIELKYLSYRVSEYSI